MGIRLVQNAGNVVDPAVINMRASGTTWPNGLVEFSRTGAAGVYAGSSSSTTTNIFGVVHTYVEGASDVEVKVTPFASGQLFEVDCTDAALTAQIGLRHVMDDSLRVRNTSTDLGAGTSHTAVFRAVAMTGSTSGSGKLIGYFRTQEAPSYDDASAGNFT